MSEEGRLKSFFKCKIYGCYFFKRFIRILNMWENSTSTIKQLWIQKHKENKIKSKLSIE